MNQLKQAMQNVENEEARMEGEAIKALQAISDAEPPKFPNRPLNPAPAPAAVAAMGSVKDGFARAHSGIRHKADQLQDELAALERSITNMMSTYARLSREYHQMRAAQESGDLIQVFQNMMFESTTGSTAQKANS